MIYKSHSIDNPQQASIGIFDSGLGGLTVLRELYRQLPNESIIYFADTARLPYGTKSVEQIRQFVREIMTWMARHNVKMAIIACNTATAAALVSVRLEFGQFFPILGTIAPVARTTIQHCKRIGVIATTATVISNAYPKAFAKLDSSIEVFQADCPALVSLVENNCINRPNASKIVRKCLTPLLRHQIDSLILGCTHFPHLAPTIRKILPSSVRLVDPAVELVTAAARKLEQLHLLNPGSPRPTQFYVSDRPEEFARRAKPLLGFTPVVAKVSLPKVQKSLIATTLDTPLAIVG